MAGKIRIKGGELHVAVLSLKFPLKQTIQAMTVVTEDWELKVSLHTLAHILGWFCDTTG